jgi:hypothetical protein
MGHAVAHVDIQNLSAHHIITLYIHMEDIEWADSTWNGFISSNCVSFGSDLVVNVRKLTGTKPKLAMVWHIWTPRTCQHIILSHFTSIYGRY